MSSSKDKVSAMKKVYVTIFSDKTTGPFTFDFIYGVGPRGLTPFEMLLGEKEAGEEAKVVVRADQLSEMFGHLSFLLPPLAPGQEGAALKIKVERIEEPGQKEIIKAMAEASTGCSCCGSH